MADVLGALIEARRSTVQIDRPATVDRKGQRHGGGGKFDTGARDTEHATVLAAMDDAHAKVAAVDPEAAKSVKSARDIAAREHQDRWDEGAVRRNLQSAHERIRHGVSRQHEEAVAALGAAHQLHAQLRHEKRAAPTSGGLVAAPPPMREGVASAVRARYDEAKHKRGGFTQNRGWFSPGAGPPATSGRSTSKPGAPQRSTSAPSAPRTPKGVSRPRTPLRPAAPGTRPDEPSHTKPKLTEDELPAAVGRGSWDRRVADTTSKLRAGEVEDTEQAYRAKLPDGKLGPYPPERIDLHNRILKLLFQGAGFHGQEKREAVFMAGGPASGKSSLIRAGKVKLPPDAVDVNPDIIRTMLPEYGKLVDAKDPLASSKTHEEASHIAKMAMNLSVARGHHVVVDGTGNSAPGKFAGKIKAMLGAGYEARVIYATTDVETALKRADDRGQKTGRFVPTGYIRSSHRDVSHRFVEDISAIPGVGVEVYDTTNGVDHIVSIPSGSTQPQIKDRAGFERFVGKAQLPTRTSYADWLDRNVGAPQPIGSR